MVRKEIDVFGDLYYYNEKGQFHREDGPAIEYVDGTKVWYINNLLHRVGGPALEYSDGDKYWFKNNLKHRLNAPAIIRADGSKGYWEFGVRIK